MQSPSNALKNQRWLPPPQAGGGGGGGGDVGGGDGGGGVDGGEGGWNCTSKDSAPWLPLAKEKLCPKPGATHSFPNQPSKREFVISRVHVAPSATANGSLEAYGAPNGAAALSVVPSEQLRLQPTAKSPAPLDDPLEQVIAEKIDGGGGDDGGTGQAVWQTYFRPDGQNASFHLPLFWKLNSKQASRPPELLGSHAGGMELEGRGCCSSH